VKINQFHMLFPVRSIRLTTNQPTIVSSRDELNWFSTLTFFQIPARRSNDEKMQMQMPMLAGEQVHPTNGDACA